MIEIITIVRMGHTGVMDLTAHGAQYFSCDILEILIYGQEKEEKMV